MQGKHTLYVSIVVDIYSDYYSTSQAKVATYTKSKTDFFLKEI